MPNVSPIFLLRTKNAAGVVIQGATQIYRFLGNVVLTNIPGAREVQVAIGGQSSQEVNLFEDWISGTAEGVYGWLADGSTPFGFGQNLSNNEHWGVAHIEITEASGGGDWVQASVGSGGDYNVVLGGGVAVFETIIKIPVLSITPTRQYIFMAGLGDTRSGPSQDFENGIYFEYNNSVSGDFWVAKAALSSVHTDVVTTVPVVADQWYRLRAEINADATEAKYYIDDVLVATINSNICTEPIRPTFYYSLDLPNTEPGTFYIGLDTFKLQATLNR